MAEFFYTNVNFEAEKAFVHHVNKVPYRIHGSSLF